MFSGLSRLARKVAPGSPYKALVHSIFGKPADSDNARTGRRAPRIVRIWDRSFLKPNQMFKTADGHEFAVHPSGAFVRTDKDRRSVKERKAARRAQRAAQGK